MSLKKSKWFFHKNISVESSHIVKPNEEMPMKKIGNTISSEQQDHHQNIPYEEKRPSLSESLSNSIRELNYIHDEVQEAESTLAGMISEMKEKKHVKESDMLAMRLCFHKAEMAKKDLKKTLDQIEQNEDKHEEKMVLRARKLSSESSTTFSKVKTKPMSDHHHRHYADQKQHHYNQKPRSRSVATPDCSRPAAFGFFSSKRPSIQNEIYNKEQQTSYYNWNRSNTIQ